MKHLHIEGTGKPLKVVAAALTDLADGIIAGKEYVVMSTTHHRNDKEGWGFVIIDNNNYPYYGTELTDEDVVGGNWIVTERAPE